MKIIDASWEKRNLGLSVQEIFFEEDDSIDELESVLIQLNAKYQVAKINARNHDILAAIQNHGFKYIEDQIRVCHDLHEVERNRLHQRLQDSVTYHKMNDSELEELYHEVSDGMFDTDRIALDNRFGKDISSKRYINWIKDLVNDEIIPYALIYKGSVCAFVLLKEIEPRVFDSILGGYYKDYRYTGLGIVEKEMDIVRELGGKKLFSSVSSNNPVQLRAMCINGYVPVGINHVLVRHVDEEV